jgi:hypothetical protein
MPHTADNCENTDETSKEQKSTFFNDGFPSILKFNFNQSPNRVPRYETEKNIP